MKEIKQCNKETEIYSRVTGYHRPLKNWNYGKQNEFKNRKNFKISEEKEGGK
jgi:anaerobic ribonucleoside-triphosphate reductase